jgi:hypothetical protein
LGEALLEFLACLHICGNRGDIAAEGDGGGHRHQRSERVGSSVLHRLCKFLGDSLEDDGRSRGRRRVADISERSQQRKQVVRANYAVSADIRDLGLRQLVHFPTEDREQVEQIIGAHDTVAGEVQRARRVLAASKRGGEQQQE